MQVQIPRCFDHHNHFSLYLTLSMCPSLAEVNNRKDALDLIASLPSDRPNLVTGWHTGRFSLTEADLEGMPPVAVINLCLHGYLMNRSAADMAEQAGFSVNPSTSLEAEKLMPNVLAFFGRFSSPDVSARDRFVSRMRRLGLYGMEDMFYIPWDDPETDFVSGFRLESWMTPETWLTFSDRHVPGFKGLKLFADGAVGASTAAVSQGFINGGCPVLTHSPEQMLERLEWCLDNVPAVAVHAIGDMAAGQVVDAVAKMAAMPGRLSEDVGRRVRMEHLQFITYPQAMQARELGITLSLQPNFNEDSATYTDRLGPGLIAANQPFRMLIDDAGFTPGVDLLFGSDGMPHGLVGALQNALFPPVPSQKLSIDELLAGYSADNVFGHITVEIDYDRRKVRLVEHLFDSF